MNPSMTACVAVAAFAWVAGQACAQDKPLKSVGITLGDMANPFFVAIGRSAQAEARKINPAVKVTAVSSKYDLNTQVDQIDNFIANKVDVIVLGAADSRGVGPAVRKARAAGIVVVAVDVTAEGADATVMSDNAMAGAESCGFLAERIGGKGRFVIVNGPPVSSIMDRVKGCKQALARYPGIRILSDNQDAKGSRDGGLAAMAGILTAHPRIDAVFGVNDPTAIGAELAIRQARRTDIQAIGGVDGSPDGEAALKARGSLFVVTPAQDPHAMAAQSVRTAYGLLNGRPPPRTLELMPTPLITRDSIGSYTGWVR